LRKLVASFSSLEVHNTVTEHHFTKGAQDAIAFLLISRHQVHNFFLTTQ
jgi:hypothetical protein